MERIKSERELLKKLYSDVDDCGKGKIVLLGGHFPLVYLEEAVESFDKWGLFSIYSLELACKVGKYAKEKGKVVEFVFFVDDHIYEDMALCSGGPRKRMRGRLYRKMSGDDARLPDAYRKILLKYGFSEDDVIRQNQGKNGRGDCLYFSEKLLRASKRKIDNDCAREYTEFIEDEDYFSKGDSHLVTFAPRRCQNNICQFALNKEIKGLSSSHIFMESMDPFITKKGIYSAGVDYLRS